MVVAGHSGLALAVILQREIALRRPAKRFPSQTPLGHLRESNSLADLPASIVNRYEEVTAGKRESLTHPNYTCGSCCTQPFTGLFPDLSYRGRRRPIFPAPAPSGAVAQGKTGSFRGRVKEGGC
jgi:hypothetical protein